jgi:prepilin-type N-terminal cleavage/methylation domain-containing protein
MFIKLNQDKKGFTLVELMVVVATIAILTTVAIAMYLNFQRRAKAAEARANLGAAKSTLVAYYAENDDYNVGDVGTVAFTTADNQGTPFGNSSTATGGKMAWDNNTTFSVLGFASEGRVYFNYSLDTNNLSDDSAAFTVMASADLDSNGLVSHYYLHKTSKVVSQNGDGF